MRENADKHHQRPHLIVERLGALLSFLLVYRVYYQRHLQHCGYTGSGLLIVKIKESAKDLEHQLVRKPWHYRLRHAANQQQLDHAPRECTPTAGNHVMSRWRPIELWKCVCGQSSKSISQCRVEYERIESVLRSRINRATSTSRAPCSGVT